MSDIKLNKQDYLSALSIMFSLPKGVDLVKLDLKTLETLYYGVLQNAIGTSDLALNKKEADTKLFIANKRIASLEAYVAKLGGKV